MIAPTVDTKQLGLIRISLLGGVLLFGAVTWYQHHQGAPGDLSAPPGMDYLLIGAFVIGLGGVAVVRVLRSRTTDAVRRLSLATTGWVVGEVPALAGGVYYWLTDDPRWWVSGVFVLLIAFILIPIRGPD